jgi:hypothetical protein
VTHSFDGGPDGESDTDPDSRPDDVAPALPDSCGRDGRIVGAKARLWVDPDGVDPGGPDLPLSVVCTDALALARFRLDRPATGARLYLHAGLPAAAEDAPTEPAESAEPAEPGSDEHVHGWPVRRVHTAAVVDLGGVVAEIVHLGHGHCADDLVVSVRALDDRGRPRREVPIVVYAGPLVVDGELTETDALLGEPQRRTDAQMRAWADSLDLLCGLLGSGGLAVTATGQLRAYAEVDAQRVARLQASGPAGTGRVGMPPPDWQLPLA